LFVGFEGRLLLAIADIHVELSEFVSILARSWNLDGSSPVVIEEAQSIG